MAARLCTLAEEAAVPATPHSMVPPPQAGHRARGLGNGFRSTPLDVPMSLFLSGTVTPSSQTVGAKATGDVSEKLEAIPAKLSTQAGYKKG